MAMPRSGILISIGATGLLAAVATGPAVAVMLRFERDLAEVEAGSSFLGRAILEAATQAETCLALASSNTALVSVPATLTIPAGQSSGDFRIQVARTAVPAPSLVTIQATVTPCAAPPSAKRGISVLPPPYAVGMLPTSQAVQSGNGVTLQVKLNRPAAYPGASLALANNGNGLLAHPKSVTVPSEKQEASIAIATQPVIVPMTVQVSAAAPGTSPVASTVTLHGSAGSGEPAVLSGMLNELNKVRTSVAVPALRWNANLAATAQNWASSCADQSPPNGLLDHNGGRSNGYPYAIGETIFGTAGSTAGPVHIQAVGAWASEATGYNPASGTFAGICSNFTQVVWRSTLEVGCGVAVCPQLGFRHVVACNYAPAGNTGQRAY